jgi:hypothetical protein
LGFDLEGSASCAGLIRTRLKQPPRQLMMALNYQEFSILGRQGAAG